MEKLSDKDLRVILEINPPPTRIHAIVSDLLQTRKELAEAQNPAFFYPLVDALVKVGMGKSGKSNTLTGMVYEIIAELTALHERWIPVSEDQPEVGEVVSWSHPSWKRAKEGFLTGSGRLKVWGGEYTALKNMSWRPLPQPPEGGQK